MNVNKIFRLLALMFSVVFLFSCSKEEAAYDFDGVADPSVFLVVQEARTVKEVQTKTRLLEVVKTPISVIGKTKAQFPVYSTAPLAADARVSLSVQNELVEAFNKANGTDYGLLDPANLIVSNPELTIKKGSTISEDSISIAINPDKISALGTDTSYVVPISITSSSSAKLSENLRTVFLVFKVRQSDLINYAAGSVEADQLDILNPSGWVVTTENANFNYQSGSTSDLFDGNPNTTWYANSSSRFSVKLDLGSVQSVSGFTAYQFNRFSGRYNSGWVRGLSLQYSTDNINWNYAGKLNNDSFYMLFYGSVRARYFRWTVPADNLYYIYISTIDVYGPRQ